MAKNLFKFTEEDILNAQEKLGKMTKEEKENLVRRAKREGYSFSEEQINSAFVKARIKVEREHPEYKRPEDRNIIDNIRVLFYNRIIRGRDYL